MRLNLVNGFDTAFSIPGVYELLKEYFEVCHVDNFDYPGLTIINQRDREKIILTDNIIFENLWEIPEQKDRTLESTKWFWINESLWYRSLGLDSYTSNKTWEYSWLMPMNLRKPWRTIFKDMISSALDRCVWSYCAEGILLPGSQGAGTIQDQREFLPAWWDSTSALISIESNVALGQIPFPTEKTLRGFAFSSPTIIVGSQGLLEQTKEWGFESWSELWDESYDKIVETIPRMQVVADIVNTVNLKSYPKSVLEKLSHNKDLFWNYKKTKDHFEQIIVEPITRLADVG